MRISFLVHRSFLGLLMVLVLMLGVQGVAEAADLQLQRVSGNNQEKQEADGLYFAITFSVTERSPKTIHKGTRRGSSTARKKEATNFTHVGADEITPETASDYYYYDRTTDSTTDPETISRTWLSKKDAYHYNEESVKVALSGPTSAHAMTFKLKASTFQRDITDSYNPLKEDPTTNPNALRGNITLICTPSGTTKVGTYKVIISDGTILADTPWTALPPTRSNIDFTLRVTQETPGAGAKITTKMPDGNAGSSYLRKETSKKVRRIDNEFHVANGGNLELRYRIDDGGGELYAATSETATPYQGPGRSLTVHEKALVFLTTKSTDNEVIAAIVGQPRTEPTATILYEYIGDDRRDGGGGGGGTTPTVSVSSSSLSGAPGDEVSITVTPSTADVTASTTFVSGGGFVRTRGSVRVITLPNTPGRSYILTASASGYNSRNITVRVTGTDTGTGTGAGTLYQVGEDIPTLSATSTGSLGSLSLSGASYTTSGGVPTMTFNEGGRITLDGVTYTCRTAGGCGIQGRRVTRGTIHSSATARTPDTSPATTLGTLRVVTDGAQIGTQQQIQVLANPRPSSNVAFTVTSGGVRVGGGEILTSGIGRAIVTVPTTGIYILTVTAVGYNPIVESFTASGTTTGQQQQQQQQQQQTVDEDEPEPSYIEISGSATRTGVTINKALDLPLLVQVLDADDEPVAGTRVIFRVRKGQGRLSERGNGRAVIAETDRRGYARTDYTPMSATSTVEAEVRGVARTVTFTISTGSAPPKETTTPGTAITKGPLYQVGDRMPFTKTLSFGASITESGVTYTCVSKAQCAVVNGVVTAGIIQGPAPTTPRTAPTTRTATTRSPVVDIAAASRPPMLWVEGGAIYTLVGANVQRFAPSATDALNVAIGGGKVYWTEKTGDSAGTINSANLDGTGVKQLTSIRAVPMGIAVDTVGSKLYWANSRGRIQSANLDGSGIQNVVQNLTNPLDIALAGGNVYWTYSKGGVGFVNLKGQKQVRNISNGSDAAGSLTIGGGKVYWTEQTANGGGTVNSANLNGTGAKQLASILAAPMGIAVDGARSKLYWTNSRGRIQSAALDGSSIRNVVSGLSNPGEIVLSNSIKAPTGAATTTTAGKGKYDVNGDGSVDDKDSDALIVAVAAGITDAKYDVNGDGKVDINDVVAVRANRSAGAAGAPALIGNVKLSTVQINRLQEQIDLLIATGDRSPAAMKTLIYLQQLIAMARPEKTQLLANYPNPFNPETWIPYELATDTTVKITIYNSNGVVVRTLQLGQQSAGYYTDRERAAYWDGRNALGERVASGIYFYQLETDEMSSLRKMVILK